MSRETIYNIADQLENRIWSFQFSLSKLHPNKRLSLLSSNENYRNIHKGETCFILGNGPSLKYETRLSELRQYNTFSVNQLFRSPLFDMINPKYHVMLDPLFFTLDEKKPSENDTLIRIKELSDREDITMILPIEFIDYINQHFGEYGNRIYVKGRYRMCEKYKSGFDLTRYIPAANNVVLTAIYCAIYMGFTRIVLLGCDMTGWLDSYIRRSPHIVEKFSHIYEYNEEEKNRMRSVHSSFNNEAMLTGFAKMFKDYRLINQWCMNSGISLTNASQETALDNIPYSSLDDILDELDGKENE